VSSGKRLGLGLAKPVAACKTPPSAAPPPRRLVDGMGGKMASPTGERVEAAQGRRRAATRQQKRVGLRALGGWPAGPWESVPWQMATGEAKVAWAAWVQARQATGMTANPPTLVVSEGAHGLENALGAPRAGVSHPRGLFHTSKQIAAHLVVDALKRDGALAEAKAVRKATQARQKALRADAGQRYAWDMESAMRAQAAVFRAPWAGREPAAGGNCCTDFDQTFSYVQGDVPRSLASLLRTTNLLERWHKEVRRTQHDIGMLQSERGCAVLWYLITRRESATQQAALRNPS